MCTLRCRYVLGMVASLGAVASTVLTELLCDAHVWFFRWYPGHALWHVLMAYGILHLLMVAAVLEASDEGRHEVQVFPRSNPIYPCCGKKKCCARVWFLLMPGFEVVDGMRMHAGRAAVAPLEEETIPVMPSPSAKRSLPPFEQITHTAEDQILVTPPSPMRSPPPVELWL